MTAGLERTGRAIVAGTWGCALIVMAASSTNAALAYRHLGDYAGIGIAVDVAQCVALIGDRRLQAISHA